MDNDVPLHASAAERSGSLALVLTGIGSIVLFFLIFDLLGWVGGGGIFSITSAVQAVHHRTRMIDVDGGGLRLLFVAACSIAVTMIGLVLRADMSKRSHHLIVVFSMMGGGFIFDGIYGEFLIERFMEAHGYSRCFAGDHVEGNGKSRVWFDNYVITVADCPTEQQ